MFDKYRTYNSFSDRQERYQERNRIRNNREIYNEYLRGKEILIEKKFLESKKARKIMKKYLSEFLKDSRTWISTTPTWVSWSTISKESKVRILKELIEELK